MNDRAAKRFERGEQIVGLRPKLNWLVDAANATLLEAAGASQAGSPLSNLTLMLEIKAFASFPDLVCVYPGMAANPSTPEYIVTTPPSFSWASRSGVTYTYTSHNERTATGTGTETQYLQPDYQVGDLLMVEPVLVADVTAPEWRYVDRNFDGRQWVADPPP